MTDFPDVRPSRVGLVRVDINGKSGVFVTTAVNPICRHRTPCSMTWCAG